MLIKWTLADKSVQFTDIQVFPFIVHWKTERRHLCIWSVPEVIHDDLDTMAGVIRYCTKQDMQYVSTKAFALL